MFVASDAGLTAIRLADGAVAWTAKLPGWSCERRAAVVRGVVVLSCVKRAVAFDARTGRALWRKPIVTWTFRGGVERRAVGPPTATSGLVFVQDVTDGLSAIEPRSGRVIWHHVLAGTSSEPATASGGVVYVPSGTAAGPPSGMLGDTVVQAIDGRTGTVRWTAKTEGDMVGSGPVLANSKLFVSIDDGYPSLVIDARTGSILRRLAPYGLQFPAASNGVLVTGVGAGLHDQGVAALRVRTGRRLWHIRSPDGLAILTPTIIAHTAYVTSNQGGSLLYALNVATGRQLWAVHLKDVGYTTAARGLLLVTAGSRVIAYRSG